MYLFNIVFRNVLNSYRFGSDDVRWRRMRSIRLAQFRSGTFARQPFARVVRREVECSSSATWSSRLEGTAAAHFAQRLGGQIQSLYIEYYKKTKDSLLYGIIFSWCYLILGLQFVGSEINSQSFNGLNTHTHLHIC